MSRRDQGQEAPARQGPHEPWWHWLIAAVGALLIAGTAGYLAYHGFTAPVGPPAVALRVEHVERNATGYVAVIEAFNYGERTAAGLTVKGTLLREGKRLGESEFTFDYLPPNASRRGGLFFGEDPRLPGVQLRLEPSGYQHP